MTNKPLVRFKGKIIKEVKHLSIEDFKELFEGNVDAAAHLALMAFQSLLESVMFISVVEYEGKKFVRQVCVQSAESLSSPLTPEEETLIQKCEKEAREDSASIQEWDSLNEETAMVFTLYSGRIFNAGEGNQPTFLALCHSLFHYLESGEFFNAVLMYNEFKPSSDPSQPGSETIFFMPLHVTKE